MNNWERVRGNVRFTWSETPVFDRRLGVAVEPVSSLSGNLSLNLYPTRAMQAEVTTALTIGRSPLVMAS